MGAVESTPPASAPSEGEAAVLETHLGPVHARCFGPASATRRALAIHGQSSKLAVREEWANAAAALGASGYRVVVPDWHSNDRTAPPAVADADIAQIAALALGDSEDHAAPVLLLGKSWGGAAAARYAAAHGSRVAALVLVAPAAVDADVASKLDMPLLLMHTRDDAPAVSKAEVFGVCARIERHVVDEGGHRILPSYSSAIARFARASFPP